MVHLNFIPFAQHSLRNREMSFTNSNLFYYRNKDPSKTHRCQAKLSFGRTNPQTTPDERQDQWSVVYEAFYWPLWNCTKLTTNGSHRRRGSPISQLNRDIIPTGQGSLMLMLTDHWPETVRGAEKVFLISPFQFQSSPNSLFVFVVTLQFPLYSISCDQMDRATV